MIDQHISNVNKGVHTPGREISLKELHSKDNEELKKLRLDFYILILDVTPEYKRTLLYGYWDKYTLINQHVDPVHRYEDVIEHGMCLDDYYRILPSKYGISIRKLWDHDLDVWSYSAELMNSMDSDDADRYVLGQLCYRLIIKSV